MIISCSNQEITNRLLVDEYFYTQQFLQRRLFVKAIQKLEFLYQNYSFNAFNQEIQLNLIYAYYKNNNFYQAYNMINNFIELYPTSTRKDLILYIKGILSIFIDNYWNNKRLYNNKISYNIKYIKIAYFNYIQLVENFPNSKYLHDAKKKLILLKNRLIQYESSMLKFYEKEETYAIIINRATKFIKIFPKSQEIQSALLLINKAYKKFHLNKENKMIEQYFKYH